MRYGLVCALAAIAVLSGCAPGFPVCVREHAREQVIRWGEIRGNAVEGYQIAATTELFAVRQAAPSAVAALEPRGSVDAAVYCDRLDMVRHAFLDVQALNVPGDTRRFVEFSNPKNGLELRAIWNPEYETAGNARFRAVYDSLETMRAMAD